MAEVGTVILVKGFIHLPLPTLSNVADHLKMSQIFQPQSREIGKQADGGEGLLHREGLSNDYRGTP